MLWNIDAQMIADGYGIGIEEFLDTVNGSGTSPIAETVVAKLMGGKRVVGKQLAWDVEVGETKVEVRNICNVSPSFAPSTATGKGRFFSEGDFLDKISKIDCYVFVDLTKKFREPPRLFKIPADLILEYYEKGILSKNASLTQKKFFELFPYDEYGLK